jgi:hypothetical protein
MRRKASQQQQQQQQQRTSFGVLKGFQWRTDQVAFRFQQAVTFNVQAHYKLELVEGS